MMVVKIIISKFVKRFMDFIVLCCSMFNSKNCIGYKLKPFAFFDSVGYLKPVALWPMGFHCSIENDSERFSINLYKKNSRNPGFMSNGVLCNCA